MNQSVYPRGATSFRDVISRRTKFIFDRWYHMYLLRRNVDKQRALVIHTRACRVRFIGMAPVYLVIFSIVARTIFPTFYLRILLERTLSFFLYYFYLFQLYIYYDLLAQIREIDV